MIREITLLPTSEVSDTQSGGGQTSRDPGSSPYPPTNTPEMTLAEVWSDEDLDSYWYMKPNKTTGGIGTALAGFEAPPTLVIVRSVKLQAWWTYSQSGPNNWYFPPTNAYGPRARLAIRNRAKTDNNYGSWHEFTGAEIDAHNENINTGNGGYTGPYLEEWETTSHPEGGVWTIDDLSVANFAAGIQLEADGPAFDNSQGSFFKIRVHKFRVIIEVEDLGGYVDNIRHSSAVTLRLMRRARNTSLLRLFAHEAKGSLGDRVYLSHPRGPSVQPGGWGERRLERRPTTLLKRTIFPESFRVEDELFDLQAYACLFWAAYRIDCAWSPNLNGLAQLDKGGGFTHVRDQDAWSPRPGDGMLMRVIDDYPNLSYHGLAAQGGDDVAIALYNYDLMGTGWSTVGNAGDFSVAASTTAFLVEEQGYLSSALLTFGAAGGQGGRERSLGTLDYDAGDYMHVRVIVRNTSVPVPATDFLEVQLYRSAGGLPATEYWDEANRAWTAAGVVNNPIPASEPFGEVIFDAIPTDAALASSDPTYYIRVGRFSSNIASCSFNCAVVDVQKGGATWGGSYGARTPLVTTSAEITREPDVHRLDNSLAAELWSYVRGVVVVEVQPFWRADVLPTDTVKPLVHADHAAESWDAIQFVAKTGSDDLIRFERGVSGQATFQLDCPIASLDLTRAHVLRAWARWLGDDGWTEYGPWSVEVGYAVFLEATGALVQTASIVGTFAYQGAMTDRDWLGIGNDDQDRFADAYVRLVEVRRNPVSGLECVWRI